MKRHFLHNARSTQTGIGFLGLIIVIAFIGFFFVLGAKSIPAWTEYMAIERALNRIETSGETNVAEARKLFDKYAEVDSIESIQGSDIKFTPIGNGLRGEYEYESRIHVAANVSLVFEFSNQ